MAAWIRTLLVKLHGGLYFYVGYLYLNKQSSSNLHQYLVMPQHTDRLNTNVCYGINWERLQKTDCNSHDII